jgi:hypothetical protein
LEESSIYHDFLIKSLVLTWLYQKREKELLNHRDGFRGGVEGWSPYCPKTPLQTNKEDEGKGKEKEREKRRRWRRKKKQVPSQNT